MEYDYFGNPLTGDMSSMYQQMLGGSNNPSGDPYAAYGAGMTPGQTPLDQLVNLYYSGNASYAMDLADTLGVSREQLTGRVNEIEEAGRALRAPSSNPFESLLDHTIGSWGNLMSENPLLGTALAAAGGLGTAGAGAFGGGGGAAAGGGTLAPGAGVLAGGGLPTVGSIPLLGGAGAAGALAPGAGVLAAGGAGGLAAGGGVLAPAASAAGYLPVNFGAAGSIGAGLPAGGGVLAPVAAGAGPVGGAIAAGGSGAGSASVPGAAQLPPGGGVLAPHANPVVQGGLGLPGWLTIGGALAGALGTNNDDQTTTTASGPPEYLRPYLEQAAGQAANLYNANPSAPVVPFSPQTQEALRLTEARARAGSPVGNAAQTYGTNVLGGQYLNSNPYLDATFERAARGVTNAVQSNFGRSGRDVRGPDAAGVAAMHYGELANQIYGGNYQAERDRQQQLVPYAGQLAAQDYADYGQLAGVGAQYEGLQREQADAQGTALDQYLARLQGLPGASVTQTIPTNRNWLAGAAGGALLGSQIGQPWGSLYSGQYGG